MPGIWLFSTDPDTYSYDYLKKKGRDVWDGVKSPLANKFLREVREGDSILIYHTQRDKCLVGLARAAADARPDPKDRSGKLWTVEVVPARRLKRRVPLAELKGNSRLRRMEFIRIPRLAVSPVAEAEWEEIGRMETAPQP